MHIHTVIKGYSNRRLGGSLDDIHTFGRNSRPANYIWTAHYRRKLNQSLLVKLVGYVAQGRHVESWEVREIIGDHRQKRRVPHVIKSFENKPPNICIFHRIPQFLPS